MIAFLCFLLAAASDTSIDEHLWQLEGDLNSVLQIKDEALERAH